MCDLRHYRLDVRSGDGDKICYNYMSRRLYLKITDLRRGGLKKGFRWSQDVLFEQGDYTLQSIDQMFYEHKRGKQDLGE